ncbi:MAG: 30S ribosomal protein S17 [Candidatus Omnitrophica bacterium CG11_big_fil_rev_8_21_14_0_20_63_9]|nr:MAG: 30S ribosomal protein S17 [Candidatus Omnitrophica bacterium CG11_big_fil_rev_8_21_14_0_20_63_9]
MPATTTQPPAARDQRKMQVGTVVSNKMAKTIVVRVNRLVRHPSYNRVITRASRFKAHDEKNEARPGDIVRVMETRPISRDKRWVLVEIVRRASGAPPVPGTEEDQSRPIHRKAAAEPKEPA